MWLAHPRDPLYCAAGLRSRFHLLGRYTPPDRDARIRAVALCAPAFSFLFDSPGRSSRASCRTLRGPPGVSRIAVHRKLNRSLRAFFARAWRGHS